ncbi:MAG: hypothetical protein IKH75_01570 [Ruminococcus sp.]|nr:hypothetical protein [Ruminococcus sp.]
MALFKKKNQVNENKEEKKEFDVKAATLEELNSKLNGHLYDGCIIMPRGGYTIDVNVGRNEEKDGVSIIQVIFIVRNDAFDEPIIEPIDSQGKTPQEAVNIAVQMFMGGLWHPLEQADQKKNGLHVSINYLMQHYDFDMYAQSIVRIGVEENKTPTMLINYIKAEIPKYLGSKKYYWVRIYLAKYKDKETAEIRVNGSVCSELGRYFKPYMDTWDASETFMCEKQYAIFVQREDDKCPFTKETVVNAAKTAIEKMVKINSREDYNDMAQTLEDMTGDKNLAAEIRIFIPEILAKMTLGYQEGDSLFLLEDDSQIEFKKTQLRSYFYLQQVLIEYLSTRPPQEDVQRIVFNSVAFREVKKAHDEGHEPKELYVPGTSYKIGNGDYKVW